MNEHLKPDEAAMLERAEKATKGPWERGKRAVSRCPLCEGDGEVDSIDINGDGWTALAQTYGIGPMIEDNAAFITAAPSDLPTILKRLANERAKLAIAVDAMGRAATELSREVPPQYAGTDREGLPIEVEHSSVEMACGMASMDLATALAHINELEKQS